MLTPRTSMPIPLLGVCVLLSLLAGLLLLPRSPERIAEEQRPGASQSRAPRGTARLRLALDASGAKTTAISDSSDAIPTGTLLVIEPTARPSDEEMASLRSRLQAGTVRVIFAGSATGLELAQEIHGASIPRMSVSGADVEWKANARYPVTSVGSPRVFGPGMSVRVFEEPPEGFDPLVNAADGSGCLVARSQAHDGRILLVSDPMVFENAWLAGGDNVELILSLLAPDGAVVFDDRWQAGVTDARLPMMALVYGTGPGKAFVCLILILLFLLFLRGIDPGGPTRESEVTSAAYSYVDALASLHGSVAHPPALVASVRQAFCRRVARRFNLARGASHLDVARTVAPILGVSTELVVDVLEEPVRHQALALVARLDDWTAEISR